MMDEQSNNWRSFVGLANCPRGPGVPYHLSVFLVCFSFCLFLFILFASSGVWMLAGPVASGKWRTVLPRSFNGTRCGLRLWGQS